MFPSKEPLNIREASAADAEAVARVHVAGWRETYPGLVPQSVLDNLDEQARLRYWTSVLEGTSRGTCVFVAEDAQGVFGFSCGGAERTPREDFSSELYAIYVLQRAQGRGAGKRLFQAVVDRLIAQGHKTMLVWVLEGNPACGFYEAMGGRRVDVRDDAIGDVTLRDIGYGFDIRT